MRDQPTGQLDAERIVAEMSERLIPINHALNLITQRLSQRTLSIEAAQETRLIKQLQGCVRSLGLRLSELGAEKVSLQPRFSLFSINTIVQSVLNDLQTDLDAKFLIVKTDIPLEDTVKADPELVRMAVYFLIRNAIRTSQFDGEIMISLSIDHDLWDLEIADSGPGLESAIQAGWSGDTSAWSRLSTDFRYCIAKVSQIANCHGGSISLANCAQGGAAISLNIPRKIESHHVSRQSNDSCKDAA